MSQMSGYADGAPEPKVSNTSRAVLLLAGFVVLFIILLHELDNSPSLAASTTKTVQPAKPVAVAPTTTTLMARTPADVKVLVANGVGVDGAASKVAARLQPIGYQLAKPGNTTTKQTNSVVEYVPGYQADAQAVATSLGLSASAVQPIPNPAPVTDIEMSNVIVIVGSDLANASSPTSSSTTSTTTGIGGAAGSPSSGFNGTANTLNGGINGPLTSSTTVTTTSVMPTN
jgi:hypothetical protein